MEEKAKSYGEALSKLIQVETVSASNHSGPEKFHAFHAVLKECFPLLFSVCEAEDFSGSLMLRWQGSNAKDKPPVMFMKTYREYGKKCHSGRRSIRMLVLTVIVTKIRIISLI